MFGKVLVANRGAIACRVIRTLDKLGVASVAVYSDADRFAKHTAMAGEAVPIGPSPAAESYLKIDKIIAAALATGAEAIHPGYGFLSEKPDFAEACAKAGIKFIGPRPEHMRAFGLKHTARELAERAGVPLAPGSGILSSLDEAQSEAARIGYPVMLKSTAGGGGIGLQLVQSADELPAIYERVARLAANNFSDAGVFLEKYVARGRHIEVQIFGDGRGTVVALGERDCSAQRRNQKVLEETPAPSLSEKTRAALLETAVKLGEAVNYENAGTVEYLFDAETSAFYFLEVNTRLQVEHGVTEEVTGTDLVEWMVRQAAGENLVLNQAKIKPTGASIQARIYAEDPGRDFRPSTGLLTHVAWPEDARIESWVESGTEVSPYYDPMLAKVIVTAPTREAALSKLQTALDATEIAGIETNVSYLRQLSRSAEFERGEMLTRTLQSFDYRPSTFEVLSPGTQTTVQDWPGRLGYWAVGVPPSGPMDSRSFRLANRLVGNAEAAAGLEFTLAGPTLRFNTDATIALAGADMAVTIDGEPIAFWTAIAIRSGETLKVGSLTGSGSRAYLAVRGGIDVPPYLGSRSTFTLGKFGGHAGRVLKTGDVIHIAVDANEPALEATELPVELRPSLARQSEIGVLYGPHGAPDFFTPSDIETFFATDWEVHYNSNPTGIRLIGPKPEWARSDGGEAGLHPSNIHDNAYAIGAIDFTGDMPVILGLDGPSLGGFVCPATIATAELWKIGQLRPGDKVRFKRLTPAEADQRLRKLNSEIATLCPADAPNEPPPARLGADDCILFRREGKPNRPQLVCRRAGDQYLLIEYGPLVLDIKLRFRVHALMDAVAREKIDGIIDLTPGIRSLQIHFDSLRVTIADLIALVERVDDRLGDLKGMEVASRIVHLPLSWDDPAVQKTIDRYMQSVRADAPWCPSNVEFIRRINGLDTIDDVHRIVFDATYLVMGLGDVYLGAPVATPLDPRHRLVTTKYNPARTWTPDNVVGIGGAYMCIYGMEGPGGYQLFGRTCQMWNAFRTTTEFVPGSPWLLRFFDQIRFYPVTAGELTEFRASLIAGRASIRIEPATFRLSDYEANLEKNAAEIAAFKTRQQAAFEAERQRWKATDQDGSTRPSDDYDEDADDAVLPPGHTAIESPVTGSVWKVAIEPGAHVAEGSPLIIVESMKMEMTVAATVTGIVKEVRCAEGRTVSLGQTLVVIAEGDGAV